jgi:hypothetical protein
MLLKEIRYRCNCAMHLLNNAVDEIYLWNSLSSNRLEVEQIGIDEFMVHKRKTSQQISLQTNYNHLNSLLCADQKFFQFYITINMFHDIWFLIRSVCFLLIWVQTKILQKQNGYIERNVKKPLLKGNLHLSTCQLIHTRASQMKNLKEWTK